MIAINRATRSLKSTAERMTGLRAMEEPRDTPPFGIVHDRIEPLGLPRLLALSATEEQRIEPG
jgi:hypothetical protein